MQLHAEDRHAIFAANLGALPAASWGVAAPGVATAAYLAPTISPTIEVYLEDAFYWAMDQGAAGLPAMRHCFEARFALASSGTI